MPVPCPPETMITTTLKKKVKSLSRVRLVATPWTVALQAPPSMGFSRQEYWSGLPFPSPGDLLDLGIEPRSPASKADSLPSEPPGKPDSTKLVTKKQKQTEKLPPPPKFGWIEIYFNHIIFSRRFFARGNKGPSFPSLPHT